MFHVSLFLHRCHGSQYTPVVGRWGRGKVRIGHRVSVSKRVQLVFSTIHRALQQSIERDKERAVNIMNLIVSDNQRCNFISFFSFYFPVFFASKKKSKNKSKKPTKERRKKTKTMIKKKSKIKQNKKSKKSKNQKKIQNQKKKKLPPRDCPS